MGDVAQLPGIGQYAAAEILDERTEGGQFQNWADLKSRMDFRAEQPNKDGSKRRKVNLSDDLIKLIKFDVFAQSVAV